MLTKPKCKLDDLAWIKKALREKNEGLVVQCKEYLGYYQQGEIYVLMKEHYVAFITDHYWVVESSSSSLETQYGRSTIATSPDSWLTPITPPGMNHEVIKKLTKDRDDRDDREKTAYQKEESLTE